MKQQAQHQSQLQLHSHPQQQILQQQHVPDNSATPFHIGKSIKKPKQAPSAYVLFCRDKRAEIKSQYPVAGIADQGRLLGQLWNSLDKDKKQVSDIISHIILLSYNLYILSCFLSYT